jgi:bifunctional DNase/RNase
MEVELWRLFMSEMVEVVIDSIRVSLISQQRIVILKELETERYLPIWIGVYEAEAIALALQEVEVSRPIDARFVEKRVQSSGCPGCTS